MNGPEVRKRLDENYQRIKDLLDKFVLTEEIKKCLEDNQMLRENCPHKFEDGICIYCDTEEEK